MAKLNALRKQSGFHFKEQVVEYTEFNEWTCSFSPLPRLTIANNKRNVWLNQLGEDPLDEVRDPRVDAGRIGLCAASTEWHDANQVELIAFRHHQRAAGIHLLHSKWKFNSDKIKSENLKLQRTHLFLLCHIRRRWPTESWWVHRSKNSGSYLPSPLAPGLPSTLDWAFLLSWLIVASTLDEINLKKMTHQLTGFGGSPSGHERKSSDEILGPQQSALRQANRLDVTCRRNF